MKILEKQGYHLIALAGLLTLTICMARSGGVTAGRLGGLPTSFWFALTLSVAVLHQVFVLVGWRAQLHYQALSRRLGPMAFRLFKAPFLALLSLRLISICLLCLSDRGSLELGGLVRLTLATILAIPVAYVGYSVLRYFGIDRAVGADHFDPTYLGAELEGRGSFGMIPNSMYALGFLVLWLPGLILASKAGLLAAGFQHAYIWVHYLTVERPDMQAIYEGRAGG